MEVATDGAGVAGLANCSDPLTGPDAIVPTNSGWANQVGVEVAARLALAVDQQVVAVEDRVIAGTQHAPRRRGDERRAAGGDDVKAFVAAPAAARSAELADVAAGPVRTLNWEDVVGERSGAVV